MDVESPEPTQQPNGNARSERKPATRRPRKRRTKRKSPASASADATRGDDDAPAGEVPPVRRANGESPSTTAEPTTENPPVAAATPRRTRKRRAKRRKPTQGDRAGITSDAAEALAQKHAARSETTADQPPAGMDRKAQETKDAPTATPTADAKEPPQAPRKPKRRRRSTKAHRSLVAADVSAAETAQPPAIEGPPPKELEAKPVAADKASKTGREMIINVSAGEECRIAILHEGRLEELHLERQSAESHVGNIYKGRVTNVEPSIQAAFVDFGLAKNGFLHVSDVQPKYFPNGRNEPENVGKKVPRRDRPPIHKCFHRGQEVIVQITKEGVGTKGPTLTTYLSIPGRYLVMMPGMSRLGVSRKIEDEEERHKMRSILNELSLPEEMGFILRTAGLDRTKRDLQRDLNYLRRLWKIVEDRIRHTRAPAELYQESDLVIRTIRDLSTAEFDRIVVDHEPTAQKAREFMQIAMPRARNVIELYTGPEPIFHRYGIEVEIERINSRHVPLPLGGSLVIESTEAMVTIDVNSGKFRSIDDAEETAFQLNLEAAKEIARQLRLRDLGGLVVCDFIDMRLDRHKRAVERTLRDALKIHKERARILRMSQFGLIEMTRQRQRPSIKRSIYADCPHCRGTGLAKTLETMVLEVIRVLQLATHRPDVAQVTLTVSPNGAVAVLNQRRAALHELEQETGTTIVVKGDPTFGVDHLTHEFRDDRGRIISPDLS